MTDEEAPDYRRAVAAQMEVAQAILSGLGFGRRRTSAIVDATGVASDPLSAARGPARPGRSRWTAVAPPYVPIRRSPRVDRGAGGRRRRRRAARRDLHASRPTSGRRSTWRSTTCCRRQRALRRRSPCRRAASPFGSLIVDTAACTLCLACVGACPEAALADNAERPQLRFFEKNCVQCGLCASTCPEDAIPLEPRLLLADGGKARSQPRVLNEVEPFCCVRCGKPFGTLRAIEPMVGKLGGHAMFQGAAAERLKMCGDCRIIDIHSDPDEVRITEL